jgi:hypothetical protein
MKNHTRQIHHRHQFVAQRLVKLVRRQAAEHVAQRRTANARQDIARHSG